MDSTNLLAWTVGGRQVAISFPEEAGTVKTFEGCDQGAPLNKRKES
jgi:hypothetical protein